MSSDDSSPAPEPSASASPLSAASSPKDVPRNKAPGLFASGMPNNTNTREAKAYFSKFGKVVDFKLLPVKADKSGFSCSCLLRFSLARSALNALDYGGNQPLRPGDARHPIKITMQKGYQRSELERLAALDQAAPTYVAPPAVPYELVDRARQVAEASASPAVVDETGHAMPSLSTMSPYGSQLTMTSSMTFPSQEALKPAAQVFHHPSVLPAQAPYLHPSAEYGFETAPQVHQLHHQHHLPPHLAVPVDYFAPPYPTAAAPPAPAPPTQPFSSFPAPMYAADIPSPFAPPPPVSPMPAAPPSHFLAPPHHHHFYGGYHEFHHHHREHALVPFMHGHQQQQQHYWQHPPMSQPPPPPPPYQHVAQPPPPPPSSPYGPSY